MILETLKQNGLSMPKWLDAKSCAYLTITGSVAYAVSDDLSDMDLHGFCMPPMNVVFPHTAGTIKGFGDQGEEFGVFDPHHIPSPDGKHTYDFAIYNITKFFDLCKQNNPNMLDCLFTPENCVLHQTEIARLVRSRRKIFLHRGSWHKFKGYAFAQMSRFLGTRENMKLVKMANFMEEHGISNVDMVATLEAEKLRREGSPDQTAETALSSLADDVFSLYVAYMAPMTARNVKTLEEGSDTKAMYHVVRLMLEVEQILTEGDLDLQRNKEVLKSIRRGEWSVERLQKYYETKLLDLETVYSNSPLPHSPDEKAIKTLLMDCLEMYYGDLSEAMKRDVSAQDVLADMRKLLEKHGG